ncbi:MAG: tRNA-intron lyase [Nanohaloarchaea archaeon]|nr:tRNA-intron lyase [Candidatus Nanohaloarchaea archaeon]
MTAEGKLSDAKVKVWDEEDAETVHSEFYYGKYIDDDYLELSLVEALHLVDREELEVVDSDNEVMGRESMFQKFSGMDDDFDQKYAVYSDLRERGYIVKTGFKFGAHFRVYPRGVNPYKDGPKEDREHTKWIVNAVPENYNQAYQEMSRAVRLAQNIRATMMWAVVDSERQVTYYEVDRVTP